MFSSAMGEFVFVVTFLLGVLFVLVAWLTPFVGLGAGVYYLFRGRISRRTLRVLVVGIPLAVAFALGLIVGFMFFIVNTISN